VIGALLEYREYRRLRALLARSPDRIKIDQVLALRDLIQWIFAEVPFYADRLRANGHKPGDLRTVKDLAGMPATSAAAFTEWVAGASGGDARAGALLSRGAPRDVASTRADAGAFSLDGGGRVVRVAGALDARAVRARRLHLRAALAAWGAGPRTPLWLSCGDDFGQGEARGLAFGAERPRDAGAGAGPHRDAIHAAVGAVRALHVIEPGQLAAMRARAVVLRGAPVPGDIAAALGLAPADRPRVILGDAVLGPIAWECAAGGVHPIGARAVIEAVTPEGAVRGLTGGSRASRAPRTEGELHVTLLERSAFPVFRVALGLRGSTLGAGCACGARAERIALEVPFLGPLAGAGGALFDPLPIVRAAAAVDGVRRVALVQESAERARLLVAPGGGAGAEVVRAAVRAAVAAAAPFGAEGRALADVLVAVAAEPDLPFPERGFIRALAHGPLVSIGGRAAAAPPVDTPRVAR
jgi:hypothetical protein